MSLSLSHCPHRGERCCEDVKDVETIRKSNVAHDSLGRGESARQEDDVIAHNLRGTEWIWSETCHSRIFVCECARQDGVNRNLSMQGSSDAELRSSRVATD